MEALVSNLSSPVEVLRDIDGTPPIAMACPEILVDPKFAPAADVKYATKIAPSYRIRATTVAE